MTIFSYWVTEGLLFCCKFIFINKTDIHGLLLCQHVVKIKLSIRGTAMKFSTRVSDAVHILAFIALNRNEALTSQRIAESIRTNPGCVRQLMGSLRRYGIMTSVQGHARPALSRAPADISLLDIYRAVEGGKPLLHLDTHTNPECGVGVNIQLALQDYFDKVQNRAEDEMSRITLQDVLDRYEEKLRLLPSGNAPARKGHMAAEKPRISQTESGQAEGRP